MTASVGNINQLVSTASVPTVSGIHQPQNQGLPQVIKAQAQVLPNTLASMQPASSLPLLQQQAALSSQPPASPLVTVQPTVAPSLSLHSSASTPQVQATVSSLTSDQIPQPAICANSALTSNITLNKPATTAGTSSALEQAFLQYLQVKLLSGFIWKCRFFHISRDKNNFFNLVFLIFSYRMRV